MFWPRREGANLLQLGFCYDFWPVQVPKTLQNPQKSLHVTRNGNIWYIYQIIQF